jgi:hypothetical protein
MKVSINLHVRHMNRKPKNRTPAEMAYVCGEVLKYAGKGLSYSQIATLLSEQLHEQITKSHVQYYSNKSRGHNH